MMNSDIIHVDINCDDGHIALEGTHNLCTKVAEYPCAKNDSNGWENERLKPLSIGGCYAMIAI